MITSLAEFKTIFAKNQSMKYLMTFLLIAPLLVFSQNKKPSKIERPRLVVGIVIDQMRWDYLYRFHHRYQKDGGFRRMMERGFSFENTVIPYAPTVTGCGHATIYTGTVPAIHGITGNAWWDIQKNKQVNCVEDKSVKTVGGISSAGEMSPRNMLTTSISDELKLTTNFRSKVIGIALKDRGSILPAGHSADAAYWYESKSGRFISSGFYMDSLPVWVNNFNKAKWVDEYYQKGWELIDRPDAYVQSTGDQQWYEAQPFGKDQSLFPYDLKRFIGKDYDAILKTPYGNTLTFSFAKQAVEAEQLGKDSIPDFLAISFSSPDYIGHAFGPNSMEIEDTYVRLDKELGEFFDYLDQKIGKEKYLCFLSADHGVAHVPGFLSENKIPAGLVDDRRIMDTLNFMLDQQYHCGNIILHTNNYQIGLNHSKIDSLDLDEGKIIEKIINYVKGVDGIERVFELSELMEEPLPAKLRESIANGYHPQRSGDIQMIFRSGWIDGGNTGTTHGLWNPYDSHIPLLWYGWNIPQGSTTEEVYMTDIAATVAALLKIQIPSGCIGKSLIPFMDQ
jgi:predicted AlkP superfamily pyrophosphatase or phosphodiesterase